MDELDWERTAATDGGRFPLTDHTAGTEGGFFMQVLELIFVTNITNYICGEKTVLWRNFSFLYRI